MLRGITCLVVSLVLLSHNNILHHELAGHLRSYGIPDDGSEIPVLQYGLSQLLYVLERREYIARHEERSENEEVITVYRVGRRAVHEFGVDGLVKLVQEVMGVGELREEVERAAGIAAGSAGSAGSRWCQGDAKTYNSLAQYSYSHTAIQYNCPCNITTHI